MVGGVVVSCDAYRDLLNGDPAITDTITNHKLAFTFVGDVLMFPQDPMGRNGPDLNRFLSFDWNIFFLTKGLKVSISNPLNVSLLYLNLVYLGSYTGMGRGIKKDFQRVIFCIMCGTEDWQFFCKPNCVERLDGDG